MNVLLIQYHMNLLPFNRVIVGMSCVNTFALDVTCLLTTDKQ